MSTAAELRAQLDAKRAAAAAYMSAFKTADGQYDMASDRVGEFRKRNEEIDVVAQEWEAAVVAEKDAAIEAVKSESMGRMVQGEVKDAKPAGIRTKDDLDNVFTKGFRDNADMLKRLAEGGSGTARFEIPADLKTVVSIGTSYLTYPDVAGGTTQMAYFYGNAEPYFPHGRTSSAAVAGFIQSTNTDNSAFVAENTGVTDSVFVWTPTSDEVEDVQAWIPVSRNLLSDEPAMQSTIENMLLAELQKESSDQILNGTGTTPVIWGVFIRTGFQTVAKGTDPVFDACHKAMNLVATTGDANPNLFCFHPLDWQDIRLTRTTDGIYLLGNPADAGPMRLWGLPVLVSTGMTQNTGGVVDTSYTTLFENGGITIETSTEYSTYFVSRMVAISATRRLCAFNRRPSAACTITGI